MITKEYIFTCIGLLLFLQFPLLAQNQSTALDYVDQTHASWGLQGADINDLHISDAYQSKHNGISHVYLQQRYMGVDIFNAVSGIHIDKNGQVVYSTNRFFDRLEERVQPSTMSITGAGALTIAARDLGLPTPTIPQVLHRDIQQIIFQDAAISEQPITTKQVYFPNKEGQLILAWNLYIIDPRNSSSWNLFVEAASGQVIHKNDVTIYCTFDHKHSKDCKEESHRSKKQLSIAEQFNIDGATYHVFPVPVESPLHGDRALVVNPADSLASPFGWHDTNGLEGPEYTFTRGNNVHAYLDATPDGLPDGPEPNGGEELFFDFPLNFEEVPSQYSDAAITQLFYMNNIMHDFTYQFGFDEVSGNFQQNNYGRGGEQGDVVLAEAQDGSGINNANFSFSADGTNSRMQMFLWSFGGSTNFLVESPTDLIRDYEFTTAAFGPFILETISGQLANGLSVGANPNTGCEPIANTSEVEGKIVLIDRGDCFFEEKAIIAEAAGAIACIICNNTSGLIPMAGVDTLADPSIPTLMLRQTVCAQFREALAQGEEISVSIQAPDFIDSDFDNGIIAHEFGHGVSVRLTGGPDRPFCLINDEQMGEGWSDFFALASTVRPEDEGTLRRPIATYSAGQTTAGSGIRRQPYSTDTDVNNLTYDDVIGTSAPHPLGEVWSATLWDIYWTLADQYGFNPDPKDKSAGNNIAIQLVMDGMKLQACQPGFIDGRDAIIAADLINNNGANECTLWELFAARGLGWNATQGESSDRNDNVEDFSLPPSCNLVLSVVKSSTPLIEPGEDFSVSIELINNKEEAISEVIIADEIPEGAIFIPGSVIGAEVVSIENDQVVLRVESVAPTNIAEVSYQLSSDPALFSTELFLDDVENGRSNWSASDITGSEIWRLSSENPSSGINSWQVRNSSNQNDQALQLIRPVTLDAVQPVLRFNHDYDIQPGLDGGIVELSSNGVVWTPANSEQIFRESYAGRVSANSLGANQEGFWGQSEGYLTSYIDLNDYLNSNFRMRFRFVSNQEFDPDNVTEGWYVDDIEVIDMVNYNSQVCVTTAQGDEVCDDL